MKLLNVGLKHELMNNHSFKKHNDNVNGKKNYNCKRALTTDDSSSIVILKVHDYEKSA